MARSFTRLLPRLLISTSTNPPPRLFFDSIRRSSHYSPPFYQSAYLGDWHLSEMAARKPGMDFQHWDVLMDNPGLEGATKKEVIDCFVKTLAQVVGSEEEAKKRIYKIDCVHYKRCDRHRFGFGCEIDMDMKTKLAKLPAVSSIHPDRYVDVLNKDYGGELFVDGEIVQRSPPTVTSGPA